MPVEDLARSDVVTADLETPVSELAASMDQENVGSVVITDGAESVGIVTDRDLAVRVLAAGVDPGSQRAEDVMTDELHTIDRNTGFYQAATTMAKHGIRRLPVRDGDDLVGIVTADDLNELLADEHQHFAEVIRAQRPEY
ncbi:MAG: CBS domain-containing protein [Halobacteriales archaeon]